MNFLHIYTGNAKGKTTAAVGLAVRALGAGKTVALVQFDKGFDGTNEHYNERHILRTLPGMRLYPFGLERMMPDGKFRFQNEPEDLDEAQRGLQTARDLIIARSHDVIILDEFVTCTTTRLLTQDDVLALAGDYRAADRPCELVMTGRGAWPELIDLADLVTEMTLIKHYWYEHKAPAREGIDF